MSKFEMIRRTGKVLMRVRSISIRLELLGWKKGRQSNKSRGIVKHIGNNYENEDEHPLTAQSQ